MATTQFRVDSKNFNAIPQSAAHLIEDTTRGLIYVAWAGRGSSGGSSFHNREILFCAVDRATKAPGAITTVEAAVTTSDFDAISMALADDGTIVVAYGQDGVRAKESTDGGATFPTSHDVDVTGGGFGTGSNRGVCGLIQNATGSLIALVTQELAGGGGTSGDLFLFKRTGAGAWDAGRTIFNATGVSTSPFFDFTVARKTGGRIGAIIDANHAFLVGDYSNAAANIDQVRALYTTDGWTSSATTLIHDYTGTSVTRNPCSLVGADGKARAMWVTAGAGDPVFATSSDHGATWNEIGSPTALAAEAWGVSDRYFALDPSSVMYAGTFKTTDIHKQFRGGGGDSLLGWTDDSVTGLANIGDTSGLGDALLDSDGSLWRLYTRLNGGSATYEVWLLTEGDVVPVPPVPPDPGDPEIVPTILAKITLQDPCGNGAKTLHLGMPGFVDPTNQNWEPVILALSQAHASGSPLTARWNPADADLVLKNIRVSGQGKLEKLLALVAQYGWTNAEILIQYAFSGIAFTDGEFPILDGIIAQVREANPLALSLYCKQREGWAARVLPPTVLTKTLYPLLPKDMSGQRAPIRFGNWAEGRQDDDTFSIDGVTWGVARAPAALIPIKSESSTGDQFPTLLVSDKQCLSGIDGVYIFESSVNQYARCKTPNSSSNPDGGPSTTKINDRQFEVCILPVEVHADNTADGAQECIREDKPQDLSGAADLDFDAGKKVLALQLPDLSGLGDIVSMQVNIAFAKNASSGTQPRYGYIASASVIRTLFGLGSQYVDLPSGGTSAPATLPDESTSFVVDLAKLNDWPQFATTHLICEVRDAGQKVSVHRITLTVTYKAAAAIVTPDKHTATAVPYTGRNPRIGGGGLTITPGFTPEVVTFGAKQFGYPIGVPDENHASLVADGTYTGTPGALIEHPADLMHWLVCELGGLAQSEVVTDPAAFGSFAKAKTALAGYKVFGEIAAGPDGMRLQSFLEQIAGEVLCWPPRKTTEQGAPMVLVPWIPGTAANYRSATNVETFDPDNRRVVQGSFRPGLTPIEEVANVVRVNFDYDPQTGTYAEQVYVTPTGSRGWTGSAFARDENTAAPDDRETLAAASEALYGTREYVHNAPHVKDAATATDLRNRLFDWKREPRVLAPFSTFINAADLERGHVIQFGAGWDALVPYPKPCSDGSWAGKNFIVYEARREGALPNQYAVRAVET